MKYNKTESNYPNPIDGTPQELTQMFISGEDGLLTAYHNDDECEITGGSSNIFHTFHIVKTK